MARLLNIAWPWSLGATLPPLPAGFVFLVDDYGVYLTDDTGRYLITERMQ